jgi:hypothetical protein
MLILTPDAVLAIVGLVSAISVLVWSIRRKP